METLLDFKSHGRQENFFFFFCAGWDLSSLKKVFPAKVLLLFDFVFYNDG